tara:strand:- start:512 stop:808 length:297 start_codon:yes stop_codon:yes gene_type:complete
MARKPLAWSVRLPVPMAVLPPQQLVLRPVALGIVGGPIGATVGGIGGAVIGALLGGATGASAGVILGDVLDERVLDNYRCLDCGYSFSVDPDSPDDIR